MQGKVTHTLSICYCGEMTGIHWSYEGEFLTMDKLETALFNFPHHVLDFNILTGTHR